jgi:diamine N-acetyltransferase
MKQIKAELRKLKIKDAPFMLEWMHDDAVTGWLGKKFKEKCLDDCLNFIMNTSPNDIHWAIVNKEDIYQGTVSLKNISKQKGNAEFAIAIRKEAMGKGYASYALSEAIYKGFKELKLKEIYWCVDPNNIRAIRFYEKNGFRQVKFEEIDNDQYFRKNSFWYTNEQIADLYWYHVTDRE